jgi:UDP-N-acetylglucosamine 2-epimerase (non-hydrolysing)
MKAAPLMDAIIKYGHFEARLIHTGQHFDENMSDVFFDQLGLPKPDQYLDIHQENPAKQIGETIIALDQEFASHKSDLVIVFGDVNSTLAAAISANKNNLRLAHVEAGLRSFDRSMPEEHNRIVTDMLSDYLFTPSRDADENLLREGIASERIFFVGNIMVDSLMRFKKAAEEKKMWESFGVEAGKYVLVTLHRPSNVDHESQLTDMVEAFIQIQKEIPLLFPVHPRTRNQLGTDMLSNLQESGVKIVEPLGYLEFLSLMMKSRVVLTDSGGIQEETTVLGIPCLTLRANTERPITMKLGTNRLAGKGVEGILKSFHEAINSHAKATQPESWDGKTASRIEEILNNTI